MTARSSLVVALLVVGGVAQAQTSTSPGPRWESWLGCWTSAPTDVPRAMARAVCITPTSSSDVVDVTVIADGHVIATDTIDASGKARRIEVNGCAGTEEAVWSADARRVFLKSNVTCGSSPTQVMAILALTPAGEWIDVRGVASPGRNGVHVERYRPVGVQPGLSEAKAKLLAERQPAIEAARALATAPVGIASIIEATRVMEGTVVEAWLIESGQTHAMDAKTLEELKSAGVSQQITDAMIATTVQSEARYVRLDELHGIYNPNNIASNAWDMGTGMRKVFVMPVGGFFGFYNIGIFSFPYADPAWVFGALPGNSLGRRSSSGIPDLYPPVIKLANSTVAQETQGLGTKAEKSAPAGMAAAVAAKVVEKITSKGGGTKGTGATNPNPPKNSPFRSGGG